MFEAEIKYLADGPVTPPGEGLPDAVYRDTYFDSPDGAFTASGRELRLREADGRSRLTYKHPPFDAATGSKEELETLVADGPAMAALLGQLGFVPRQAYAKRCRCFRDTFRGLALEIAVVAVDFSPEVFVEIEHLAPSRQAALAALPVIRAYAASLGLSRECRQAYTDLFTASRAKAPGT
ncbi:MAG: class IV adenylate cyclase [Solidesulfovibrio sp. DCME]|uniref:class IV adenylate cyclase n=1 Tax=Solidesulfovibrio sp. DCME TaxID=3447380 RepID=UPI003D0DCF3E